MKSMPIMNRLYRLSNARGVYCPFGLLEMAIAWVLITNYSGVYGCLLPTVRDGFCMKDDDGEPEHVLCKRWRVERMNLTRDGLAAATGFSASMIKDYERADSKIDAKARRRYRLVCAAVHFGIDFHWGDGSLMLTRPFKLTPIGGDE
jgi:hypothetical protein